MANPGPLPVTVIVPVKDEERNLPACLAALDGFERVVVVDSGSVDATAHIAQAAGAEVVQFHWSGGFPKKRNWTLMTLPIRTPWVLFLDADEVATEAFKDELRRVLPASDRAGFWLRYRNHFLGRPLRRGVEQRKLALFRPGAGLYERIEEARWSPLDMEVHEHPVLEGPVGEIRAALEHRDFRGMEHYIARHQAYAAWEAGRYLALRREPQAWTRLTPRQRLKYAGLAHWWFAPAYFVAAYVLKGGFLDGWPGFVHAALKADYFRQVRRRIRDGRGERAHAGGA